MTNGARRGTNDGLTGQARNSRSINWEILITPPFFILLNPYCDILLELPASSATQVQKVKAGLSSMKSGDDHPLSANALIMAPGGVETSVLRNTHIEKCSSWFYDDWYDNATVEPEISLPLSKCVQHLPYTWSFTLPDQWIVVFGLPIHRHVTTCTYPISFPDGDISQPARNDTQVSVTF